MNNIPSKIGAAFYPLYCGFCAFNHDMWYFFLTRGWNRCDNENQNSREEEKVKL